MEDDESVGAEWFGSVEDMIQKNFDKILNRDSLYLNEYGGKLESEIDVTEFVLKNTIFKNSDISPSFNEEFWTNAFKYIHTNETFRLKNNWLGFNEGVLFNSARESCLRLIEYTTFIAVMNDPRKKSAYISSIFRRLSKNNVFKKDGSINFYPSYHLGEHYDYYANSILMCNRVIFVLSFCELLRHNFQFTRIGGYTHGFDSDGHQGAYFKNVLELLAYGGTKDDNFSGFKIMRMSTHRAEDNNAIFRDLRSLILGEVVSIAKTIRDKYDKSDYNSDYSETMQDEDDFNGETSSEDDESDYNSDYSKTRQDEEEDFNGENSSEEKNVTSSATSKSLLNQFKKMNIEQIIQHLIAINRSL